MTIKIPDVAEVTLLTFIRNGFNSFARLHLFKNDIIPGDSDTLASYTEATFPGYAVQGTNAWSAASSVGGVAQATHPTLTFLRGSGGSGDLIYGYYLTDTGGTTLYYAERDPGAPVNMVTPGNSYAISLLFQFLSQF